MQDILNTIKNNKTKEEEKIETHVLYLIFAKKQKGEKV